MEKKHTITISIDGTPTFTIEVRPGTKIIIGTSVDSEPTINVIPPDDIDDSFGTLDDPDFKLE